MSDIIPEQNPGSKLDIEMSLLANIAIFVMGSAFTGSRAVGSRQLDNAQTQTTDTTQDTRQSAQISQQLSSLQFLVLSLICRVRTLN